MTPRLNRENFAEALASKTCSSCSTRRGEDCAALTVYYKKMAERFASLKTRRRHRRFDVTKETLP